MECENSSRRGRGCSISPQCVGGDAVVRAEVFYEVYSKTDVLYLCVECLRHLHIGCRKHGYKIVEERL